MNLVHPHAAPAADLEIVIAVAILFVALWGLYLSVKR